MKKSIIEIKTCKITGKKVKMEYIGDEDVEEDANGHKGWLCLHN